MRAIASLLALATLVGPVHANGVPPTMLHLKRTVTGDAFKIYADYDGVKMFDPMGRKTVKADAMLIQVDNAGPQCAVETEISKARGGGDVYTWVVVPCDAIAPVVVD